MQKDFHYYATYCAAFLAGYSHEESLAIGYSAQFVDCCSQSLLTKLGGPKAAATTQLQMEMMDAKLDPVGLQNITRIWYTHSSIPLWECVNAASLNPATTIGLEKTKGSLEVGKDADILIAGSDFTVQKTIIGGEIRYDAASSC